MCALSATIRSKPSWWIKYQDPAIRAKWKAEAVGAAAPYGDIPLREDEVDYVLDELAWHEIRRDEDTGIEVCTVLAHCPVHRAVLRRVLVTFYRYRFFSVSGNQTSSSMSHYVKTCSRSLQA